MAHTQKNSIIIAVIYILLATGCYHLANCHPVGVWMLLLTTPSPSSL